MSLPFVYKPRPNEHIKIDRRGGGADGFVVTVCGQGAGSIAILAEEAQGFAVEAARAICEAAGKPEPVILERPSPVGAALGCYEADIRVFPDGTHVRVQATTAEPCRHYWHARLKPAAARKVAATIAAIADVIEDEPDRAEVEELAAVIRSGLHPPSSLLGLRPAESDRIAARAALKWMRDKQQQGESRDA